MESSGKLSRKSSQSVRKRKKMQTKKRAGAEFCDTIRAIVRMAFCCKKLQKIAPKKERIELADTITREKKRFGRKHETGYEQRESIFMPKQNIRSIRGQENGGPITDPHPLDIQVIAQIFFFPQYSRIRVAALSDMSASR